METIKLDKFEIQKKFSREKMLKDIVLQLEKMVAAEQKVICRLRVNGLLLSEKDEDRFSNTGSDEIHEIEMELENLTHLIHGTVQSLIEFATVLKSSVTRTADAFRSSPAADVSHRFASLMPNVQCFADALIALKPNLGQIFKNKHGFSQKWDEAEVKMMQMVTELIVAYEKQDFVLVSDVLEYELSNSIDNWMAILSELS